MQRRAAPPSRGFFVGLAMVFALGAWLSSGTLSPYAAGYRAPEIIEPCQYLGNVDHAQFMAHFHMFRGDSRELWAYTRVLRRILYPLIAFPFVTVAGVEWGGLVVNVLVHLLTAFWFLRFLHTRFGETRAQTAAILLATYPGAAYWIGLPYSYALIVPSCLVSAMALYHLDDESLSLRGLVGWSLVMGVLFLGYDLLPYFGPAALIVLLRRRRFVFAAITPVILVLPNVVVALLLAYVAQVPMMNENTRIYENIFGAYAGRFGTEGWLELLTEVPYVFIEWFLAGNFYLLPALFLLAVVISWVRFDRVQFDRVEGAILTAMAGLFLFLNLAPPYPGWEMRGVWIPRLYQPAFVAFILYVTRIADSVTGRTRRFLQVAVVGCALANGAVLLSPLLAWTPGLSVYALFYKHAPIDMIQKNLALYGRRPLGFCRASE